MLNYPGIRRLFPSRLSMVPFWYQTLNFRTNAGYHCSWKCIWASQDAGAELSSLVFAARLIEETLKAL